MLVYYANNVGVLYINGMRIYGASTGHDPSDVSWEMFKSLCKRTNIRGYTTDSQNRDNRILVQATYRAHDLRRIFNRKFSEVAFKYDEIEGLHNTTLGKLFREMGLKSKRKLKIRSISKDRKYMIELIKKKIRDFSPDA